METTTPTFRERLNARLEGRKVEKSEKGLALLDVLIGMAIFALIAIIAVTAISQYRARAYESGAVSDAKAVALQLEADFTDDQAYPADAAAVTTEFAGSGGNLTSNNEIGSYTPNGETFVVCIEHDSGAFAVFDSEEGTITDKGRSGNCP